MKLAQTNRLNLQIHATNTTNWRYGDICLKIDKITRRYTNNKNVTTINNFNITLSAQTTSWYLYRHHLLSHCEKNPGVTATILSSARQVGFDRRDSKHDYRVEMTAPENELRRRWTLQCHFPTRFVGGALRSGNSVAKQNTDEEVYPAWNSTRPYHDSVGNLVTK